MRHNLFSKSIRIAGIYKQDSHSSYLHEALSLQAPRSRRNQQDLVEPRRHAVVVFDQMSPVVDLMKYPPSEMDVGKDAGPLVRIDGAGFDVQGDGGFFGEGGVRGVWRG